METLTHFKGSDTYYIYTFLSVKVRLTEGANFVREECGANWLIDMICSFHPKLRKEEFQVWTLKNLGEEKGWVMTCTDGNDNVLASQDFSFSDFPFDEFIIWKDGDVILLPSEY